MEAEEEEKLINARFLAAIARHFTLARSSLRFIEIFANYWPGQKWALAHFRCLLFAIREWGSTTFGRAAKRGSKTGSSNPNNKCAIWGAIYGSSGQGGKILMQTSAGSSLSRGHFKLDREKKQQSQTRSLFLELRLGPITPGKQSIGRQTARSNERPQAVTSRVKLCRVESSANEAADA